jgi:CubicO group peptidase (beta-lactamase class C family)
MQLAEKRLINIDEPIQRYIPEFSIKYHTANRQPVTIRSIMAHQAGIFGDKQAEWSDTAYPAEDFRTFPEFANHEYAAYNPDYTTAYSNFAVSLLGLVIERVSHQKYENYLATHILKPCGMDKSGFDPKKENSSLLAQGYDANENLYPYYYIAANPAGFLASNSDNMANFIRMIINNGRYQKNRILFPSTLNYMYSPQSVFLPMYLHDEFASGYNFGLSWMIENKSFNYLGKVVGHGGNLPPYNSNLLIAKDQNIGVFVSANKEDFDPNEISYIALAQAGQIFRNLKKPELPEVPRLSILPEHRKNWYSGTYCIFGYAPIEIYSENDTLYFQPLHSERIPLVYHADDWFSLSVNGTVVPDFRLTIRYIAGRKVLCTEDRNSLQIHRMISGNELSPKEPLSDTVRKLVGLYVETSSGDPALNLLIDTLSCSKSEVLLATNLIDDTKFVLKPVEDNSFMMQGMGRGAQETIYLTGDTSNYSGYKFIKSDQTQSMLRMASSRAIKTTSVESPEDVISDLKKIIEIKRTY